jgi:hypothetical protein
MLYDGESDPSGVVGFNAFSPPGSVALGISSVLFSVANPL